MSGTEYQKIPGPFRRHVDGPDRNKVIIGDWASPELDYLADAQWLWTEKVDGTSVDRRLREHPGAFITVGRQTVRNDGIEDVAGWGDDGDPWTGGAA